MIEIGLYQPGPEGIDLKIEFPSSWNELLLSELHKVAQSFLSNYTEAQAQAFVFLNLLKSRCGKKAPGIEKKLDPEDTLLNGCPAMEFLYKENNLTQQPYPKIKLSNGVTVFGPHDDFNNLTCGEFEDAEIFFNEFRTDPNAMSLANLAAVLYRPAGAKYLTYNPGTNEYSTYCIEANAKAFKKLKAWELYTIFLWYTGCREQLPKVFPECFRGSQSENTEPDFLVFTKCIHAGAGPKNGSRTDIRRTLLKEYMLELQLETIKNDELQAEIDKSSR